MTGTAAGKNPTSRQAKRDAMELEPAVVEEWAKFPDLPGTHLLIRSMGRTLELVERDGSVWASSDNRSFTNTKSVVQAGGRTYRWLQVSQSRKRDVAWKAIGAIIKRDDDTRELVNTETYEPVLRLTGHHFNRRADTYVTLPDHGTITLPVRGWSSKTALMSAIADSGATLVDYRLNFTSRLHHSVANPGVFADTNKVVEIVVSPTGLSIPAIRLVVAATYGCLSSFSASGGSF
jgi:hypothetical protein